MLKKVAVFFEDSVPIRREICKINLPVNLFCTANEMEASLICGHDSDLSGYYEGNTIYSSAYSGKLVIVYSGGGNPKLSKIDIESGRVCRLIRTIGRAKDGITTEEWEQIYELIDGDSFTDHEIHPIEPVYLSALSILCQGYLATNSNSPDPLVQEALEEMGWNTFKNSSIQTDLSDKESETKKKDWWLEPFTPKTIDDIHKQIVKEWNKNQYSKTCDHVYYLLQALKQNTIEDPTIVANAYLAISDSLAHESL